MYGVFKLLPMLDNPAYDGLILKDNAPVASGFTLLSDFHPWNVSSRNWAAPRLSPVWRPREVVDPLPDQKNDYPCIGLTIPTFSGRAVEVLRDLLEPNGELLPLTCATGEYWAYNVTTVADVLDRPASEIKWPIRYKVKKQEPIAADAILYYAFVSDRLAGLSIFRIPEDLSGYYVTQLFADRVAQHGLRGFNLEKVWPLPQRPKGSIRDMERRAGL